MKQKTLVAMPVIVLSRLLVNVIESLSSHYPRGQLTRHYYLTTVSKMLVTGFCHICDPHEGRMGWDCLPLGTLWEHDFRRCCPRGGSLLLL